jgi:hypothetical protein
MTEITTLDKNEPILFDQAANLLKWFRIAGRLKMTNQRLIFVPSRINIQKQWLNLPISQIQDITTNDTRGLFPNKIIIKLVTGQEYKMVVWNGKELIELINQSKSAL